MCGSRFRMMRRRAHPSTRVSIHRSAPRTRSPPRARSFLLVHRIIKMTDTPDEPDWSLLPREPVRFFGVGEGFDRRELKRAYNELIRRFKPEKHPQEFQRIRAAFEQIDSGIRYGLEISSSSQQREEYQWSGESQPTTPGRRLSTTARPTVVPLHERLANGNVTEVYGELSAKS